MEGDLSLISIPELIQIVCLGGHSRDIQIFDGSALVGVIGVRQGRIDRCFAFGIWGEQAFFRLMQIQAGRYRVSAAADLTVSDSSLTRYSWQELLMEAARLQDEAQQLERVAVGSGTVIPFPSPTHAPAPHPSPEHHAAPAAPTPPAPPAQPATNAAAPANERPKAKPTQSEELFSQATQHYLLRDLDRAEELFEEYLRLNPGDKRALHNLERIRRRKSP
jgi:hypothetical protein